MTNVQTIALPRIENNRGQIEGVPRNPRFIKDYRYKQLVASLQESNLTDYKPLLVFPLHGSYVCIGGNMRLRALQELKAKEVSCIVLPPETDAGTMRKLTIIDNSNYGEYDWDLLANEWEPIDLSNWGVSVPDMDIIAPDSFDDDFSNRATDDKDASKQIGFSVNSAQAVTITKAINTAKKMEDFASIDMLGNANADGNALYYICNRFLENEGARE